MSFQYVDKFDETLKKLAPYMQGTVSKAEEAFGQEWKKQFNETLEKFFKNDEKRLENAIKGYIRFSIDATKLQKRFEKELNYINKSYEEAASAVYHNEEYMYNLYLPGILLSHYLWPHHYRQLRYFHKTFMPYILNSNEKAFCDIGVGTGFYSRQILSASEQITGTGFDISDYSINYARRQIEAFGFNKRWECIKKNIITEKVNEQWPFIVSVEIIEHLEDPLTFLKGVRKILRTDGKGFITAAITAPNEDHIYLYNSCEEVILQLHEAGFKVLDYMEERAYEPKNNEPVPRLGAFIVQ